MSINSQVYGGAPQRHIIPLGDKSGMAVIEPNSAVDNPSISTALELTNTTSGTETITAVVEVTKA